MYNEHKHQTEYYDRHQMESLLNDAFRSDDINVNNVMNGNAEAFYAMLYSAQQPLYEGSYTHNELSIAMRLLSIKSEYNIPHRCLDDVLRLMQETIPTSNCIPKNFSAVKSRVTELGLDFETIDCCPKGCMICCKVDATI